MPAASFPFSFFVLPFSLFLPWGTETKGKSENRKTKIENSPPPQTMPAASFPFSFFVLPFSLFLPWGTETKGKNENRKTKIENSPPPQIMPSGPLREVGAGGLSVYFIQTKSAITPTGSVRPTLRWALTGPHQADRLVAVGRPQAIADLGEASPLQSPQHPGNGPLLVGLHQSVQVNLGSRHN